MTAQRSITRLQDADDITGGLSPGDGLVFDADGTFHPTPAGGSFAIQDASDLTGTVTDGWGFVWDDDASVFVWTNLATQDELDTHANLTTTAHGGIVASSDARLSDARTPTTHKTSHATGGGDALTASDIGAAPSSGISPSAITGTAVVTGDSRLSDARTPTAHKTSHATGGGDALTASDIGAAPSTGISPSAITGTAVVTADSRLSDARTPTAHKSSHATGGSDALAVSDIVGSHGITSLMLAAEFLAIPQTLFFAGVRLSQSATANDYVLFPGSIGVANPSNIGFASGTPGGVGIFYFDPAVYALTGLTLKGVIAASCVTNATAPTVTFVVGLYPITTVAGTNGNNIITANGAVVTGSTVTFTTPGASSMNQGSSGAFTPPAAGYYALGVNVSGTAASNSTEALQARLSIYWV